MQNENQIEPRRSFWQRIWNPKPIDPPKVDPEIENLDAIQRSAESIRYSILSIEFWISPCGQVREWLRQNGRLAVWLAIPAFLVVPLVTWVLIQFSLWLSTLGFIAAKLILLPILAFIALIVILATSLIIRGIFK